MTEWYNYVPLVAITLWCWCWLTAKPFNLQEQLEKDFPTPCTCKNCVYTGLHGGYMPHSTKKG